MNVSESSSASRARWAKIIVTTVAATLLAIYVYGPYSSGGRQARNMRLAREHVPKIQPLLDADPRFAHVTAADYTGKGGSLGLYGAVRSEQDLADLKRLVESTAPPVPVAWLVAVYPPPFFDEAVK